MLVAPQRGIGLSAVVQQLQCQQLFKLALLQSAIAQVIMKTTHAGFTQQAKTGLGTPLQYVLRHQRMLRV